MRIGLSSLLLVLALTACGGGSGDGRKVFERAEQALKKVDRLNVHLSVHSFVSIDRSTAILRSQLPLERLHVGRWAKHPRRVACGHGFECARADLDVDQAAEELDPVLPPLPIDPSAIDSATVEVRLDSRGRLRRVDIRGDLPGADVAVELRPEA